MVAPSFSATATLAGIWALQILGGHPETIAQSALLLAAYVAARLSSLAASAPLHALVAGVGSLTAAALALALSAFQWLPTLELLPHSVRAVGALTFTQQITLSAEPWRLATGPAGRMPLALALVGLWTWRRHAVAWFLATAAAVLLLLSTGPATPLFAMFRHLPTGTWFRAPTRFLNLWPLCIAVLAAAGVDGLLLPTRDRLRRVQIVAASALTLAALRVSLADRSDWARLLLVIGVFDVLPLLAVSTLISARAQPPASTGVWRFRSILVLAVICAAPGFYLQRYMSPLQLDGVYQQYGDLFRELRRQSPARVLSLLPFAGASSWAKLGTYFEVPVLNDLEPLSLADFRTFSDLLRGDGRSGLEALFTTFMGETAPPREHFDPRMLNLSGVRFILISSHVQTPLAKWFGPEIHLVPWRRSDSAVVYENRSALPRAFFIPSSDAYPTPPRCIDALRAPQFDPRHDLLLDHVSPSVSLESGNAPNRVDILDYAPNRVRLAVTTGVSGFVVLTDAFYPGWTASLDHSNAPVLRADCFFRAVRTSAGTHEIVFQYAPWSFTVGTVVSAAALVAMVTLGTNGRRRARRRVLSQTADVRDPRRIG
jgi:hypothetical protein